MLAAGVMGIISLFEELCYKNMQLVIFGILGPRAYRNKGHRF